MNADHAVAVAQLLREDADGQLHRVGDDEDDLVAVAVARDGARVRPQDGLVELRQLRPQHDAPVAQQRRDAGDHHDDVRHDLVGAARHVDLRRDLRVGLAQVHRVALELPHRLRPADELQPRRRRQQPVAHDQHHDLPPHVSRRTNDRDVHGVQAPRRVLGPSIFLPVAAANEKHPAPASGWTASRRLAVPRLSPGLGSR
jgi:hypothetical protein